MLNCRLPNDKPVSYACQDLIRRIFTPLPEHRITIPQILQHPWFMVDLPDGMQYDWNCGIIPWEDRDGDRLRAEEIRGTVRAALMAGSARPYFSDSAGSMSGDMSDMEGANF